nr:hypothetical protein LTR18_011123 [Exophiala xenobiotica]
MMLVDIEKALTNQELENPQPDRIDGLRRLLLEAQRKLEILSALVSEKFDFAHASVGGPRIARLAWLRHSGKVKRIQSSLNQTHDRITATLGAANLYETALIRVKLHDLAGLYQGNSDQWSRHGRALHFISANFHHLGPAGSLEPAGGLQQNADGLLITDEIAAQVGAVVSATKQAGSKLLRVYVKLLAYCSLESPGSPFKTSSATSACVEDSPYQP